MVFFAGEPGESFVLSLPAGEVRVEVLRIRGGRSYLGVVAPREITVLRSEVVERAKRQAGEAVSPET